MKMKVAFVIHDLNKTGGQERSTWEIINQLKNSFEIHCFASSFGEPIEGVNFHRIPVLFRRPLFLKDLFFRLIAPFYISRENFDLIHTTGTCIFKSDIFTIQFVQGRWYQESKKLKSRFGLSLLKNKLQLLIDLTWEKLVFNLNRNSTFIAISDETRNDLKSIYNLKNVVCIHHGVNINEFSPAIEPVEKLKENLGLNINCQYILFVGTFERKGLYYLIEALGTLKPFPLNWKLLVIGSGDLARALILAKTHGISDKIIFLGNKNDVHKYYQIADLFILPSLYDPFGLVGIEALASGCPSILSKQSGCSELLKQNYNGWILNDPTNIEEYLKLFKAILIDQKLDPKMKMHARESVQNEDWSHKKDDYLNVLLKQVKS